MWFFIIEILALLVEAPYVDLTIRASNNMNYYIREDYIEVDLYIELITYLEYDDLNIFDDEITNHDIEAPLSIPDNFNINNVAAVYSYVAFRDFELIIAPDATSINYTIDVYLQLLDRENAIITSVSIPYENTIFKEISIDYPYYYDFPNYYFDYEIRHDVRGFTPDEIYQDGYRDGYTEGQREGFDNGYRDGYIDGEYYGSMTQPIFKLFNAVFRSIDNVLQTEVLPGIKLWYIVSIPLVFLIIQFFINLWR